MQELFDAAILGGGPAGISCATTLVRLGRRAAVLERSNYEGPRFGETLGPEIRPLLEQIGAWNTFIAAPHVPCRSILSCWGSPAIVERSSIYHPLGEGWHVDRAQTDRIVAQAASDSGVELFRGTGACAIARTDSGWNVTPANGPVIAARFLIDASGRGAPATASFFNQREWRRFDKLIAISASLPSTKQSTANGELLLEASENGWWYSAPQPDGSFIVTYLTDADLLPEGGRKALEQEWSRALASTLHTAARVESLRESNDGEVLRTTRADSGALFPACGEGWLAIGDAAMAWDPLSGSGFARALKSGIESAAQVHQALNGGAISVDNAALVETYLERKQRYYRVETRWTDRPFWSRRIG